MIISDAPSPNFGPRADGKPLNLLILHYTDTQTAFDAMKILQDPARQVSSHYLVDEEGGILRLVPEEMRAWHAGKSSWQGEEDINSCSVGIEIQNPGHGFGYVPFPSVQMTAVAQLCRDIIRRHKILSYHVLAHSDIAPARKKDPGELFPWQELAAQGVGLWPQPTAHDELDGEDMLGNDDEIKSHLMRYGYDMRQPLDVLIPAFQRHFEPEAFYDDANVGIITPRTLTRIKSLVRQRLTLRPKLS